MKTSPRRRAREFTVQALYQAALNQASAPEVAKNIREAADFKRADADLFTALFFGAHGNSAEYMQIIRPLLDRNEKDINPIERGIPYCRLRKVHIVSCVRNGRYGDIAAECRGPMLNLPHVQNNVSGVHLW